MNKLVRPTIIMLMGGFFLSVDQILKYLARINSGFSYYIWKPWLGWELFLNKGVAFSLPLPNWLLVLITPLIILGLIVWGIKHVACSTEHKTWNMKHVAFALIMFGALSNFIDRVLFSATIDYLRILTGVINLADVMIVAGAVLVIFKNKSNFPSPYKGERGEFLR